MMAREFPRMLEDTLRLALEKKKAFSAEKPGRPRRLKEEGE